MPYATLDQFLWRVSEPNPTTPEKMEFAQTCLDTTTQEIDSFLGTPDVPYDAEALALLEVVTLDRASEHWRNVPFGALGQGPELPSVLTARDSFYRHQRKLASLQTQWGIG